MRVAYLSCLGGTLGKDGEVLALKSEGKVVAEVRSYDLERLVVSGNVVITPAAMDLLLERGVHTVLLTSHGRYRGQLATGTSRLVHVRVAQLRYLDDPGRGLDTARRIVQAKLLAQHELLVRLGYRRRSSELLAAAQGVKSVAGVLGLASTLDVLRGFEGRAAAVYFDALGAALLPGSPAFEGRSRQPPRDPPTAVLSLGYSLLTQAVEAAVNVVGLDPFVGSLHSLETGRRSLVLDLVEEFRPSLVDGLMLSLFNTRALTAEDFQDASGGGVHFTPAALRRFFAYFERRVHRGATYMGQRMTWREIILQQARRFARHVQGEEAWSGRVELEP